MFDFLPIWTSSRYLFNIRPQQREGNRAWTQRIWSGIILNNFKMFLMNSRTSFGSRTCLPERDLNFEHTSHDWSALQNYPFPNTHSDKLTVGWGWRWKGQRFMTRVRMRFISRVRIRSISRVSVRFILRVMMRITMRVMLLMEIVILMQGPCLTLR